MPATSAGVQPASKSVLTARARRPCGDRPASPPKHQWYNVSNVLPLVVGSGGGAGEWVRISEPWYKPAPFRHLVFLRYPVEYTLNPCPIFWDHLTISRRYGPSGRCASSRPRSPRRPPAISRPIRARPTVTSPNSRRASTRKARIRPIEPRSSAVPPQSSSSRVISTVITGFLPQ